MGTNYYALTERCPTCNRHDEDIHLGKSSAGWQFSFQYNGGQYYKNVPEMKKWLKDKKIINEYYDPVTHKEFWDMVKVKQTKANQNHTAIMRRDYLSHKDSEHIIDGYSFSDYNFS